MSSSSMPNPIAGMREPVAPWWHTVLVIVPLAVGSAVSWHQHGLSNAHLPGMSARLSSYVTVLAEEWFVVLLIWLALRYRGLPISSLISGRWDTPRAFFKDLGLALCFVVVIIPTVGLVGHFLGGDNTKSLANVTPKTPVELAFFLCLSLTAAFCEEVTFRGYLMHQFTAWSGNRIVGILAQGVVFGLAHGFYGRIMLAIMLQGWLLGALATWRKSLRPGMLAHGLQDVLGGVVSFIAR